MAEEANSLTLKQSEMLNQKRIFLEEIKDWREAAECLKAEANGCSGEIIEWKKRVVALEDGEQELKDKIQVQCELNEKIQDYTMGM